MSDNVLILVRVLNAALRQDSGSTETGRPILEENLRPPRIVYKRSKDRSASAVGCQEVVDGVRSEGMSLRQCSVPGAVGGAGAVLGEIRLDNCKTRPLGGRTPFPSTRL